MAIASTGRGSRAKGSNFERKIAKTLGDWWGEEFHRTPGSGGLHWAEGNNVAGDVTVPYGSKFPFVVECKNHEKWTIESVMFNKNNVNNWFKQCVGDARRVNRVPMLVFTRNYAEEFVMMPYTDKVYNDLVEGNHSVIRTVVDYEDELTKQHEQFDVLVTTIKGLTSFSREYWQEADLEEWDTFSRLSDTIEIEEEDVDDMMDKLK